MTTTDKAHLLFSLDQILPLIHRAASGEAPLVLTWDKDSTTLTSGESVFSAQFCTPVGHVPFDGVGMASQLQVDTHLDSYFTTAAADGVEQIRIEISGEDVLLLPVFKSLIAE